MSRYEKFSLNRERKGPLPALAVRQAAPADAAAIASIIAERNGVPASEAGRRVGLEFGTSGAVKFFVAVSEAMIVGFCRCRYWDTAAEPVKFPAPSGWYCLGLIVRGGFRGRGAARALSAFMCGWLRDSAGADCLYSFASAENRVSLCMHPALGFEAVSEGPGFLNVAFDCGRGVLFRRKP